MLIPGTIAWFGLHGAGLHAALALVFIVPFMPKGTHTEEHPDHFGLDDADHHSTLHHFEEKIGPIVDFGLFFFGFTAAGVGFSTVSSLSFIIMLALIFGKTLGIFLMTVVSTKILRVPMPEGMDLKDTVVVGAIGGIGLTVALFVCESAFTDPTMIASAKMGALFSIGAAVLAFILNPIFRKGRKKIA